MSARARTQISRNGDAKVADADDPRQPIRLPRRPGQELRVALREHRGCEFVDLRLWFLDDADEWKPGKGATVPLRQWADFLEVVVEQDRRLRVAGIVTDDGGGDGDA